jgi:hypothetical protein
MKSTVPGGLAVLMLTLASAPALAQSDTKPTPSVDALRVQLTVTRYEGDKRIAAVPLTLTVLTSGETSRLNMGSDMPIQMSAPTDSPAAGVVGAPSFHYKSVGTAVTATASRLDAGYRLKLTIDSTWVNEPNAKQAPPQFGNFHAEESLTLSDGQSVQFTSAADATAKQSVKVDVSVSRQR